MVNLEKQIAQITTLFINRLSELRNDEEWEKPWIDKKNSLPVNLRGTSYGGSNKFWLALLAEYKKYTAPVYLSFKQASDNGIQVLKGEKSFPVFYNDRLILDQNGQKIKNEDYELLSEENKKSCKVKSYIKHYNVFNLDQTNAKTEKPLLYEKMIANHKQIIEDKSFANEHLSKIIDQQTWVCPIKVGVGESSNPLASFFSNPNAAFYSISKDYIQLPEMKQFRSSEDFFSTLLHEMTHSTGHKNRLNRDFSRETYAREELVAEIGSTIASMELGVQSGISKQNATYIKSWLADFKNDPSILYTCTKAATKASSYLLETIGFKNELKQTVEKYNTLNKLQQGKTQQPLRTFQPPIQKPEPKAKKGVKL